MAKLFSARSVPHIQYTTPKPPTPKFFMQRRKSGCFDFLTEPLQETALFHNFHALRHHISDHCGPSGSFRGCWCFPRNRLELEGAVEHVRTFIISFPSSFFFVPTPESLSTWIPTPPLTPSRCSACYLYECRQSSTRIQVDPSLWNEEHVIQSSLVEIDY